MSSRDLTRKAIYNTIQEDYDKFLEALVTKYGYKAKKPISVELLKKEFSISDIRILKPYKHNKPKRKLNSIDECFH